MTEFLLLAGRKCCCSCAYLLRRLSYQAVGFQNMMSWFCVSKAERCLTGAPWWNVVWKKKFCLFSCSLSMHKDEWIRLIYGWSKNWISAGVIMCYETALLWKLPLQMGVDRTYLYVFHTCGRRSRSSRQAGWRCCMGFWAPHWKMDSQAEPGPLPSAVLMFRCTCRNLGTYNLESDTAGRFSLFLCYRSWPPGGVFFYYSIFLIHVKIIMVQSATEMQTGQWRHVYFHAAERAHFSCPQKKKMAPCLSVPCLPDENKTFNNREKWQASAQSTPL